MKGGKEGERDGGKEGRREIRGSERYRCEKYLKFLDSEIYNMLILSNMVRLRFFLSLL